MVDLSVIILTFNEQMHINRCIASVESIARDIFIVDSMSTDNTFQIVKDLNIKIYKNKWENNYAKQFNWALENLPIKTKWILRLDADEYLTDELIVEIKNKLPNLDNRVNGIVLQLRRIFLNREMKHGNGKIKLLRIFRYGYGFSESKWMDEHITISEGRIIEFDNDFIDHNLNNLSWWSKKHVDYAIREAVDILDLELNLIPKNPGKLSPQAQKKRNFKLKYAKQPLFLRAFLYFVYRYFFKLGFLDGKEGFLWNFLQGWWYRTLVDVKIYEIKKACGTDKEKIRCYLLKEYNISI